MGQVEIQLEAKGYALEIFLNVEDAFDSTTSGVICEEIKNQISNALIDWNMLKKELIIIMEELSWEDGFPEDACKGEFFYPCCRARW